MAKQISAIEYEQFVFDLLNQLHDEFGISDDGSFARAIQEASTIKELGAIAKQLKCHLVEAIRQKAISEITTPKSDKEIDRLADLLTDIYHEYRHNWGELLRETTVQLEATVKEYE